MFRWILDIESKLAKTLWLLLVKPGALTSAYLEGRRKSFISPARLYLFSSMIFGVGLAASDSFLKVSFQGGTPDRDAWLRAWVWSVLFMTPVFAALLVLVVRRGYYFAEHFVFTLHLHAFGFLLAGFAFLVLFLSSSIALNISVLLGIPIVIVVYLTIAFRRHYAMSWLVSVLSSLAVTSIYLVIQWSTWVMIGYIVNEMPLNSPEV